MPISSADVAVRRERLEELESKIKARRTLEERKERKHLKNFFRSRQPVKVNGVEMTRSQAGNKALVKVDGVEMTRSLANSKALVEVNGVEMTRGQAGNNAAKARRDEENYLTLLQFSPSNENVSIEDTTKRVTELAKSKIDEFLLRHDVKSVIKGGTYAFHITVMQGNRTSLTA